MKPTTIFKSLVALLLISAMTEAAVAQQRPPRDRMQRMERMHQGPDQDGMHARLPGLTDDQKEQIQTIMLNNRKQMLPIHNQLREKQAHLQTLLSADAVDQKSVDKAVQEIGDLQTSILKNRIATHLEVRKLLTDEQRVVFDSHPLGKMGMGSEHPKHGWK